ncbi:LOW QUALITY PROTEIN: hypothetical protein TorRG33x02_196990, partial [Trema orientale]
NNAPYIDIFQKIVYSLISSKHKSFRPKLLLVRSVLFPSDPLAIGSNHPQEAQITTNLS